MDTVSTALTNAWLQAVWRVQHARNEQPHVTQDQTTLTDVIESALRGGGLDSADPQWVDPLRPGLQVDRLA